MQNLRYKWSEQVENGVSFSEKKGDCLEQQQCLKCGIYRIKALNCWFYTNEKFTDGNMFVQLIANKGCIN